MLQILEKISDVNELETSLVLAAVDACPAHVEEKALVS